MILSIQYLRGFAALLVLLSHAAWKGHQYAGDPLDWFRIGHAGVDVFFVISGFVMCHTTRDKTHTWFDVSRFLGHRFTRILPLYWVLSTFALVAFLALPSMVNSGGGHTDILKSYLLIPTQDKYLIQAGWTLSYELFFYGIFAACLFLPQRLSHVATCLVLLALFLIGRLLEAQQAAILSNDLVLFATDAILVNFIYGIALYHLYRRGPSSTLLAGAVLLVAVIWLLAVNMEWVQMRYRCFRFGIPSFLLCWGLVQLEPWLKQAPSRLASYIGDASYSIYLVHPFALAAFALALKKVGLADMPWLFMPAIIAASIFAGCVCYEWIEKPLLHYFRPRVDALFARMQTRYSIAR